MWFVKVLVHWLQFALKKYVYWLPDTWLSPQIMTRDTHDVFLRVHKKFFQLGKIITVTSLSTVLFLSSAISMYTRFPFHSTHWSTFLIFRNDLISHHVSLLSPPSPPSPQHVQKPHGGSASNLNMLGFPFVFLVQRPHNAACIAEDPLSADLIR